MKRALITGASGLLGSNTAAELLQRGYAVRVFLRKSSSAAALHGVDVEYAFGDLSDLDSLQKAVKGCQVVVHAAANTRQWGVGAADYQRDNVDAVNKICSAIAQNDVERFIFVSTANVFQPGDAYRPGDESEAAIPALSDTLYISSKIKAERLLLDKANREQLPVVIVNPTFMIGPRDAQPSSGKLLLYALRKGAVWQPAGGKNFIDVRDAACGIAGAIERGAIGQRYLLANENLSYAGFFEKVAAVANLQQTRRQLPAPLLYGAARVCDAIAHGSGYRLPLSSTAARLLNRNCFYTADKAVRELQLPQNPIENAIAAALDWFVLCGYWQPPMDSAYSPLITFKP